MREMQYLSEKDLEYFEKLEEKGEAVIIRFTQEQLLTLDPEEIFGGSEKKQTIDEQELQEWIEAHKEELHARYEENQAIIRENTGLKRLLNGDKHKPEKDMTLARRLLEVNLDPAQSRVINDAISQGLDEQQILFLLQDNLTAEEMQRRCERILQTF